MAAKKSAATRRRSSTAATEPLTESQLADVRRAVDSVSGSGARSVKVHGIIVYLDMGQREPNVVGQPRPMMPAKEQPTPAAKPRRADDELNSSQRRSRRRLEKRIAERRQQSQGKAPAQAQGDDSGLAAMQTAMRRTQNAAENMQSLNPPRPSPASPAAAQREDALRRAGLATSPASSQQGAAPDNPFASFLTQSAGVARDAKGGGSRGEALLKSAWKKPLPAAVRPVCRSKVPSGGGRGGALPFVSSTDDDV